MSLPETISIDNELKTRVCEETVSPIAAWRRITSSQKSIYTSACMNDDGLISLFHFEILCPQCGLIHTYFPERKSDESQMITMQSWVDQQVSIFDEKHISFCDELPKKSVCPHCGIALDADRSPKEVMVRTEKSTIIVQSEILDLDTMLKLPYLPDHAFRFPLYEQVEFNPRKGRICVRCFSVQGKFIRTIDVTNSPKVLTSCAIWDLFKESEQLRTVMLQAYEACTGTTASICAKDLLLTDFVYLTRFVGFSSEFYRAIPYNKKELSIDKSFPDIRRLHSTQAAISYLHSFSFASIPSVRKCIGTHQSLLFYLPEIEALFQIVKDINLFRVLLESKDILELLLLLHQKPAAISFFEDYCSEIGASRLCHFLRSKKVFSYDWSFYATYYSFLNRYAKVAERKEWHKTRLLDYVRNLDCRSTSLPMMSNALIQPTCVIDGFIFKKTKNTAECFFIGKQLENCLQRWRDVDTTIISIQLADEVVAAMEVKDGEVVQAFSKENGSISVVPNLAPAIRKWARQNKINFSLNDCE